MDVGGVGGNATHADALVRLAETPKFSAPVSNAGVATAAQDTVAGLLEQLTAPLISNLIQDIEKSRQSLTVEPAGDLLSRAVTATREGDTPRALATLTELAHAHPARADALSEEPALAPIQSQVESLVRRLTSEARVDAEQRIESATHLLQSGGHGGGNGSAHRVELNPQSVIAVAERLLESGRYANVVLSADLAQAVVEYYGPFPVAGSGVALSGKGVREIVTPVGKAGGKAEVMSRAGAQLAARAKRMWRSAPLLLMLIVWMAAGLMLGMLAVVLRELSVTLQLVEGFFYIWALGFLGLVGFGFYRSIRHLRLR